MPKTDPRKLATSTAWKQRNPERMREYRRAYFQAHKAEEYATHRRWKETHPEQYRLRALRDYRKNSARRRKLAIPARLRRDKCRYWADEKYRIEKRLRAGVSQALRRVKASKAVSIKELIGCSIAELKQYLESKFAPGMTWNGEVHIDHIRPCASFDLRDPEQQRQCFHYSNLQPLWAADNIRKNSQFSHLDSESVRD